MVFIAERPPGRELRGLHRLTVPLTTTRFFAISNLENKILGEQRAGILHVCMLGDGDFRSAKAHRLLVQVTSMLILVDSRFHKSKSTETASTTSDPTSFRGGQCGIFST